MQLHVSNTIRFFGDGFAGRWHLSPYTNSNDAAVFLGLYDYADIIQAQNHKGFKVLVFTGADLVNYESLKHFNCISDQYDWGKGIIEIKDYSSFTPVKLGDKVYVYSSIATPHFHSKFRMDMVEELKGWYGADNFIIGYHGMGINDLRDNVYSKAFVNLQLNPNAGFTTANEMQRMGRQSVSNYKAPFCLPFQSVSDILKHIELESKKIGTVQYLRQAPNLITDNRWMDKAFWK